MIYALSSTKCNIEWILNRNTWVELMYIHVYNKKFELDAPKQSIISIFVISYRHPLGYCSAFHCNCKYNTVSSFQILYIYVCIFTWVWACFSTPALEKIHIIYVFVMNRTSLDKNIETIISMGTFVFLCEYKGGGVKKFNLC